jgi:hypothetical protein
MTFGRNNDCIGRLIMWSCLSAKSFRLKERILASIIIGLQFGIAFFLAVIFWATPGSR